MATTRRGTFICLWPWIKLDTGQPRDARGDQAIRSIETGTMDGFLVVCSSKSLLQVLECTQRDILCGSQRGLAKGGL